MSLFSLSSECFIGIFSFLDKKSLFRCLFVNRYYCKLSIPIIWKDPFTEMIDINKSISLISTLFSCLNEDEISSLIPCAIDLTNVNNQPPLFEYGRFVRKIDHGYCIDHVTNWIYTFSSKGVSNIFHAQDCRIQKLIDAIYHMIIRTGSNLQEFVIGSSIYDLYFDLPKFSLFTTYKPGIMDLRSLCLYYNTDDYTDDDDYTDYTDDTKYQNTIEFLSMVSKFCDCIIELRTSFLFNYQVLDIIKLQPLKSISLFGSGNYSGNIRNVLYTLKEFRSETLKELSFDNIDFREIDLSFISKLECLERLEFIECTRFTFKKKLYLKELKLWYYVIYDNVKLHTASIINFLCSETLLKLSLNIITPETVKAVETCPNVNFLCTEFSGNDLLIPFICELSSLKTLNIKLNGTNDSGPLIRLLCSNHLISVEHLVLGFYASLENFEYFINNFKANLKRLDIMIDMYNPSRKSYLVCVSNFQKIHNSLNIFGVGYYKYKFDWTDEETEIVDLLKSQGVVISSDE